MWIPAVFFAEIDKLIIKFIWKFKWSSQAPNILKQNKKFGRFTPHFIKVYCKTKESKQCATIIGSVYIFNRIEFGFQKKTVTLMINWISTKVSRKFIRERVVFSKNGAKDNLISMYKRMNLHPLLVSKIQINSKKFIDLNVRANVIKLVEGNRGVYCCDLGLSIAFYIWQKNTSDKSKNKSIKFKMKNMSF